MTEATRRASTSHELKRTGSALTFSMARSKRTAVPGRTVSSALAAAIGAELRTVARKLPPYARALLRSSKNISIRSA